MAGGGLTSIIFYCIVFLSPVAEVEFYVVRA